MKQHLTSAKEIKAFIPAIEAETFLQSIDPLVRRLGRDFRILLAYSKVELTNSHLYVGECLPIFARALLPEVNKNSRALNYPTRDTQEEASARSKLKSQILPALIEKYEAFPLLQEALLDIKQIVDSAEPPITTVTQNIPVPEVWRLVSEINKISRSADEGQKKITIDITDESSHVIALQQERKRLEAALQEVDSRKPSEKYAHISAERRMMLAKEHSRIASATRMYEATISATKSAAEILITEINEAVSAKLGYPQPDKLPKVRGRE